mmetsp:Transcript_50873/g.162813  ORF Transcript_50873/g.162813 Transcript_50873/m.162813 type:complete len:360 (+) Transcript_50873:371-1450(+)
MFQWLRKSHPVCPVHVAAAPCLGAVAFKWWPLGHVDGDLLANCVALWNLHLLRPALMLKDDHAVLCHALRNKHVHLLLQLELFQNMQIRLAPWHALLVRSQVVGGIERVVSRHFRDLRAFCTGSFNRGVGDGGIRLPLQLSLSLGLRCSLHPCLGLGLNLCLTGVSIGGAQGTGSSLPPAVRRRWRGGQRVRQARLDGRGLRRLVIGLCHTQGFGGGGELEPAGRGKLEGGVRADLEDSGQPRLVVPWRLLRLRLTGGLRVVREARGLGVPGTVHLPSLVALVRRHLALWFTGRRRVGQRGGHLLLLLRLLRRCPGRTAGAISLQGCCISLAGSCACPGGALPWKLCAGPRRCAAPRAL